jgi:hypothetical protein
MLVWERTMGILMIFFFSLLGLVLFDDRKLKMVSFATGVISAAILAGWSDSILTSIQQFAFAIGENVKPDSVGVITSAVGLTFSQAIPIKSVRRASTTTSLSGLILSIAGFPGWIILVTNFLIFVVIILAVYFIAKKVAGWIRSLVQEGKRNERIN